MSTKTDNSAVLSKWDNRFLEMARSVAEWSKDPATKIGCVIVDPKSRTVVAVGYNGLPRGVDDANAARYVRPTKYLYTEHSERNAVYNAARRGTTTEGCTMYMPWYPCADCARAIIQSGITRLVCGRPQYELRPDWADSWAAAEIMLGEAEVQVDFHD